MEELLPVPYIHVVFTQPHKLNPLIFRNPRDLLGLLFRSVSQTLLTFAKDEKFLGAKPGVVMVLHTWGRKLNLHYHVHCIVTGGGLSNSGEDWVNCPKDDFLFPVRALSKVFRAIFVSGLDRLRDLDLPKPELYTQEGWRSYKTQLFSKSWVVYAKPPFGGPQQVLKYLGQYTNRAAVSNQRIISYKKGRVLLSYKDYKDQSKIKTLDLSAQDFMDRFLHHALPSGFHRIRYSGFLAPRIKKQSLEKAREILGRPTVQIPDKPEPDQITEEGETTRPCPYCKGRLILLRTTTLLDQKRARCMLWDSS